ncbi:MAG: ComF family protein [Bacteroidetes bacterium]|nr:MAG: ComF family protein [Bacteroidota bacterium]
MSAPSFHTPMLRRLREGWRGVLDLLYPARCLACGDRALEPHLPLCTGCLRRLERADAATVTAALHRFEGLAPACTVGVALWRFDKGGVLQQLQHALKYQNRPAYGLPLGRLMAEACTDAGLPTPDVIVPVPLHRRRYLERGYNQSAWLARGLAERLGVPADATVLTRPVATRSQTHLDADARWQNVQDAFAVTTPQAVSGRQVLLVDDVMTTGATAAAALRTLQAAGAAGTAFVALALAR